MLIAKALVKLGPKSKFVGMHTDGLFCMLVYPKYRF